MEVTLLLGQGTLNGCCYPLSRPFRRAPAASVASTRPSLSTRIGAGAEWIRVRGFSLTRDRLRSIISPISPLQRWVQVKEHQFHAGIYGCSPQHDRNHQG